MEILIVWLLFGIISAFIASNKYRNGCWWFIMGLLLGPFGLILALVAPSNYEAAERAAIESGSMKKCPYCAEMIKEEATRCRYCRSDVE